LYRYTAVYRALILIAEQRLREAEEEEEEKEEEEEEK
jgi:hypothetical protein